MVSTALDETEFLSKYNLPQDALTRTGLMWSDLMAIHDDHLANISNLQPIANYISERLRQVESGPFTEVSS